MSFLEHMRQGGAMQDAMVIVQESCGFRSVIAAFQGIGIGVGFGVFMGSFEGAHGEIRGATFSEQLYNGFGKTFTASVRRGSRMGLHLGGIMAVYSGIECHIEKYRARHDVLNPILGGLITGGGLGVWQNRYVGVPKMVRGGTVTAVGFAVFAMLAEAVMAKYGSQLSKMM